MPSVLVCTFGVLLDDWKCTKSCFVHIDFSTQRHSYYLHLGLDIYVARLNGYALVFIYFL